MKTTKPPTEDGGVRLTKATDFMRDNTNGDNVTFGNVTPSGGLRYRMESGNVYQLSASEVAVLQRFSFTPRYAPAGRSALSQSKSERGATSDGSGA